MDIKSYHHGNLKNKLLELAETDIESSDFSGLSLRDIAKKAGVSHTAPYRHFRNKESLILEVTLKGLEELEDKIKTIDLDFPMSPLQQLQSIMVFISLIALEKPKKAHLMFLDSSNTIDKSQRIIKARENIYGEIQKLFISYEDRGLLSNADPKLMSDHFYFIILGFVSFILAFPDKYSSENELQEKVFNLTELLLERHYG